MKQPKTFFLKKKKQNHISRLFQNGDQVSVCKAGVIHHEPELQYYYVISKQKRVTTFVLIFLKKNF